MIGGEADTALIKKRFIELARGSERGYFTFTDFLGLAEQSAFSEIIPEIRGIRYTAFGGVEGAERVMIRFGDEEEMGYSDPFPIVALHVKPRAPKFAEKLSHRDYLGALMSLGIERTEIGDIAVTDDGAIVFAKVDMADYIIRSLERIRHTDVSVLMTEALPDTLYKTERIKIQAVGERIDAVIAKVFRISREESLALFRKQLVFINGRACLNNSAIPKRNDKISVRGHGRFIYLGYETLSKKGKLNIEIDVYV